MRMKYVSLVLAAMLVFGAAGSAYAAVTPVNNSTTSKSNSTTKSTGDTNTGTNQTQTNQTQTTQTQTTQTQTQTTQPPTNVMQTSGGGLFSDVKAGFWAEKHITKLALEKIVLGTNGKFRPTDSVTQQEAVTIAIRFMNLEKNVSSAASVAFQDGFVVDTNFKPYVALAFQNGLLEKSEEMVPMKGKETWGSKKATREWFTKILVRALGKQSDAAAAMTKATSFADNSKISPSALGYVNVASDLQLTTGGTGNRFDPQGVVTRAQAVTFFSRGDQYINPNYENVYKGVITNLTSTNLSLYTEAGKMQNFALNGSTAYFTVASEKAISASEVKPYTKVTVIDNGGTAGYVEVIDDKPQLESLEGKLQRVHSTGTKLTLLVNDDFVTYDFDTTTSILDQNGKAIAAKDLTSDSIIELKRESFSNQKKVVVIQVKSAPVNKNGTGVVTAVDAAAGTIKVRDSASNQEEQLKIAPDAYILYQNELKKLAEVKLNDVVTYVVKDGQITTLEVKQTSARTVKGSLVSISEDSGLISYIKDGTAKPEANYLAEKVDIEVDGIKNAKITDLIADGKNGDVIELTIGSDDKVAKIKVLNRKIEQLKELSVVSYSPKAKVLTVTDAKGIPYSFYVDDTTKLDFNSGNVLLKELETLIPETTKVNLTVLGDKVLVLQKLNKYDGKLVSVDSWKGTITLTLESGKALTLPYDGSTVVLVYGRTNAGFADLKPGDMISAQLRSTQDKVGRISIKSSAQFEVFSTNVRDKRLRVKSNDGRIEEYVMEGVPIYNENNVAIPLDDLAQQQLVTVNFAGNVPESVRKTALTYGKVENVDSANARITVKDFTGRSQEIKVTPSYQIIRNNVVNTNLNSLAVSDRVEVRLDANGNTVLKVLDSVSRKFSRYNAQTNEVLVQRASLSDTNFSFTFSPNAYIHKGDTAMNIQSLQDGDSVVIVLNNNKVIEIEKQ